eukprot:Skav231232  [mRNA]  locus=scaffold813:248165:248917:+ [translate_table: standard]
MDTANNYVPPEFELKDKEQTFADKEKSSTVFFRSSQGPWRRFAPKGGSAGRAENLPKQMLRFLHSDPGCSAVVVLFW